MPACLRIHRLNLVDKFWQKLWRRHSMILRLKLRVFSNPQKDILYIIPDFGSVVTLYFAVRMSVGQHTCCCLSSRRRCILNCDVTVKKLLVRIYLVHALVSIQCYVSQETMQHFWWPYVRRVLRTSKTQVPARVFVALIACSSVITSLYHSFQCSMTVHS